MSKQTQCIREVLNFSTIELSDRFDKPRFDPEELDDKLAVVSPKLAVMLDKIGELDRLDYDNENKLYKHFIFSDLKRGYGAKIIASVLIASGYKLVQKPKGAKIILDPAALKEKNESKFAVLSSTALWNNSVNQNTTREILKEFNKRPENTYGDQFRFIILDSGFKEGVDLFDVKYAHIFEDQLTDADLTQAIGRATRYCGQKGLKFKKGWNLEVYNYKSYMPIPRDLWKLQLFEKKKVILDYLKEQNEDLQFKVNFENEIDKLVKESAVDKLLNENINNLKEEKKGFFRKHIIPITLGTLAGLGLSLAAFKIHQKRKQNKQTTIGNLNELTSHLKQIDTERKAKGKGRMIEY